MPSGTLCLRGHTFFALGPAPTVVDLGANDGKFAAELLVHYPDARVVLAEGDPFLVGKLRERFADAPNVRLFAGLIGAEIRAQVPFHLSPIPEGNSLHQDLAASWSTESTREVKLGMVNLEELLALARVDRVDLVKLDVEGAEYDILPTIGPELAPRLVQLSVEFHDFAAPAWRDRSAACIAHLSGLGFAYAARATTQRHGSPYFDCHFWRPPAPPAAGAR